MRAFTLLIGMLTVACNVSSSSEDIVSSQSEASQKPLFRSALVNGDPQPSSGGALTADHGDSPQVVEFYSPFCSACKETAQLVQELARRCNIEGIVLKMVDISNEENAEMYARYDVRALPTFVFLDEAGVEVSRLEGKQSESDLTSTIFHLHGVHCKNHRDS